MCVTKYYFVSDRVKERGDGSLMISTSMGLNHARKLAEKRFQMYGYKGKLINIYPFSVNVSVSKPIAI